MTSTALLGSRELRAALDLMAVLHDQRTVDLLSRTVAERLASLVDADLVSHDDIDAATGSRARTLLVPRPHPADLALAQQRLGATEPQLIVYAGDGTSQLMCPDPHVAHGWPYGLVAAGHQILIAVTASPGRLAGFGLTRWRTPFSLRDVAVVRLVQSHLAPAFEHVALRAQSTLDRNSHGPSSREEVALRNVGARTMGQRHVTRFGDATWHSSYS